jgi:RHS repeat-associated protein
VLQSATTQPLSGAGASIERTYGYKKNQVSSVTTSSGGSSSALQFAVPRLGAPADSATNDAITESLQVDAFGRLTNATGSGGTDTASKGSTATLQWDNGSLPWFARGELERVDRGGLVTEVKYPSPNSIVTVDVDRNVKSTAELDAWLRPKNVVTTGPKLELKGEVSYDANGRVKQSRRLQGDTWVTEEYFYDAMGRATRSTVDHVAIAGNADAVAESKVDYDLGARRITRMLPGGAKIIEALDGLGRVTTRTTVTLSSDIVEQFAYDLDGNLVYSADNHVASASAFDAHGRATGTLQPDGTRTEVEHDEMGNPTRVRTLAANGNVISEMKPSFTPAGRLQSIATKVDDALTRTSTMQWDGAGRITSAATGDRFSRQRFDDAGRLRSSSTPFSTMTALSHDGALVTQAKVEEKGSAAPISIASEYDTLANVTKQSVGSLTWQQTFDQASHLTSALRPGRGEEARFQYVHDARGNVTEERKPGATFRHKYDAVGAATEYKDPLDPPTSTVNDLIGRPLSRSYADTTSETYQWDGARLSKYVDRQGRSFIYHYNDKGQVDEIRNADGILEQFEYHPSGDVWKWRTRDAELRFEEHDLEGRPRRTVQKRYTDHSGFTSKIVRDEFTQQHEWNVHGERKAWTMPSTGTRIEETYDAEGNVETIRRGGTLLLSAEHRSAGRLFSRTIHTGTASIVRDYGYDAGTGQLNDLRVRVGDRVVAGSHIDYEGVQVREARLHGVSGGARANEYTYDARGRLATSKSARDAGAPVSVEQIDAADFREALVRPDDGAGLPTIAFTKAPGHKIASVTRGGVTRTFSYAGGAERVSDGRFRYESDARGRLISATEELPAGRRILYDYAANGRLVGRRAEYSTGAGNWKLEDRAAVLAADALPADTTFLFDPISDRLAAIVGTDGSLIREYIHGDAAYDDPLEVTSPTERLYPIFDEAGAGTLQAVLDAKGKLVSRTVIEGAYGEDEFALAGAAVDRIAVDATKNASGSIERVTVSIRLTESLDPSTAATGARLAVVDEQGAVIRSAPTAAKLFDNDPSTLHWTLTGPEWTALTTTPGTLSIAVTNTLRAAAWSPDLPILPPPAGASLATSPAHPVERRESLAAFAGWLAGVPPASTRTTVLYAAPSLSTLATSLPAPADRLGVAAFQALPFAEPATGLVYARNRWYDPHTASFLSPDPKGYVDSSNLYAFAGGDPVNGRDPLGQQCQNTTLGNFKASAVAAGGWVKDKFVGFMDAGGRSTVILLDDLSPIDLGWVSDNAREARRYNREAASNIAVAAERGEVNPVNVIGGAADRRWQAVKAAKCSEDQAAAVTVGLLDLTTLRAAVDVPTTGSTGTPVPAVVTSTGAIVPQAANASTATLLAPVILASSTGPKAPEHHLGTNKNSKSKARGGPWTPRFEEIFNRAGMDLEHSFNKWKIPSHKGPHPEAYHQAVYDRLLAATRGLSGTQYRQALQEELRQIGLEAATPGSPLNRLLTKK